ncbi:MAG: ankyrin repeat domain-containing protein [Chloroflexi bacterium]|nr:ankyrin repeat domain-containing protein [Chloroflexota bacterium]
MAGHSHQASANTLRFQVQRGDVVRVETLLKKGVDPNEAENDGHTLLMEAVNTLPDENRLHTIAMLLEAGADPNAVDDYGMTAMDHAIFFHTPWEIVHALLDAGFDLHRFQGTASELLSEALLYEEPAVVRRLLEAGADPNRLDSSGQTPLIASVRKRRVRVVKLLVDHGADRDIADGSGRTALQLARRYGYWGSVEVLDGQRPFPGLAQLRTGIGFFVRIFDQDQLRVLPENGDQAPSPVANCHDGHALSRQRVAGSIPVSRSKNEFN